MKKFDAKYLIFPTMLAAGPLLLWYLLGIGIQPVIALLVTTTLHIVVIAVLEMMLPLREKSAWWRDKQSVNDLLHGFALSTIGPKLGELALFGGAVALAQSLSSYWGGTLWPNHWPLITQLILAVILTDFLEWGKHWLYHHWEGLWRVHALHHDQEKMHVFVGARLHFLEATIRYAVQYSPLIILGADPLLLLWFGASANFLGNLNHSNIRMPVPKFLHYLIATQGNHHIHHSKDLDLGCSNLAGFVMLPDILFGTFRPAHIYEPGDLGIEHNPIPNSFWAQLAAPFIWSQLKAKQVQRPGQSKVAAE